MCNCNIDRLNMYCWTHGNKLDEEDVVCCGHCEEDSEDYEEDDVCWDSDYPFGFFDDNMLD